MAKKPLTPAEQEAAKRTQFLDKAKALLNKGVSLEEIRSKYPNVLKALQAEYGYALSLMSSSPELMKLFSQAVRTGQTPQGFANSLRGTKWFQSRSESQRAYDTANNTPWMKADLEAKRQQVVAEIKRQAVEANGVEVDDAEALEFANDVLRTYYNDWSNYLPRMVKSRFVTTDFENFGGQAATTMADIQSFSKKMGVSLSDSSIGQYVDKIFSEEETLEGVYNNIRNSALSYFPQFADRIKAGEFVDDIITPYREMIGGMLEVDPAQINYSGGTDAQYEPLLQKALFGAKDGKAMSLYDTRKLVRADKRWQFTQNAKQEYANIATTLLRSFGAGV